jgi:hypothetical protein
MANRRSGFPKPAQSNTALGDSDSTQEFPQSELFFVARPFDFL